MTEQRILSASELESLNITMLHRGAPVADDGIGYNKPDWCRFYNWYSGLSNSQLATLARELVKYTHTQLSIDTQVMVDTAQHYRNLTKTESFDTSISVEMLDNTVRVSFEYNTSYVSAIKTIEGRRFDGITKTWTIPANKAMEALTALENKGADVTNAREYLNSKLSKVQVSIQPTTPVNNKIKVTGTVIKKTVAVKFPYNEKIMSLVKTINGRRFEPADKSWVIPLDEITELIKALGYLSNVDITSLEEIAKEHLKAVQQAVSIALMDVTKLQRQPFSHQIESGKFLLNNKKAILALEMGGGKTLASILSANSLTGKKLIIVPASLKINWKKEIAMVTDEKVYIVNGKGWEQEEINKSNWVIINYDILSKHMTNIKSMGFKVVIMDECHYIKSIDSYGKPTAQRGKCALEIAEKTEYVFMLTGTPIMNRLKDIFNILRAIDAPVAQDWKRFAFRYCDPINNGYGYNFDGASNTEELYEILQRHMYRKLKSEMLDLPEKIRQFVAVDVDLRAYNRTVKEYMDNRRKGIKSKGEHLVHLNALRHEMAKAKTEATIEMTETVLENGHQVVVFSCYDYVIDKMMEHFGDKACKITGDVSGINREKAVEDFQAGRKTVCVCNIKAGGVGLTLTAGKAVIFNDYDWLPLNHAQAEDRIHRIGQAFKCNIYYMYCENALIDNKATAMMDVKLKNASAVLDGREESFIDEMIAEFEKFDKIA